MQDAPAPDEAGNVDEPHLGVHEALRVHESVDRLERAVRHEHAADIGLSAANEDTPGEWGPRPPPSLRAGA